MWGKIVLGYKQTVDQKLNFIIGLLYNNMYQTYCDLLKTISLIVNKTDLTDKWNALLWEHVTDGYDIENKNWSSCLKSLQI